MRFGTEGRIGGREAARAAPDEDVRSTAETTPFEIRLDGSKGRRPASPRPAVRYRLPPFAPITVAL
ncbi:hypothetical protein DWB78_12580 [Halopelagius longus]|uniref:Uncharacterized protein n=1 Tax=Halopelagius longus TaxID=1236180 RepID=A0A370IP87_9EURY|nr:hypothetical protein DWB78_12580 [Halopelagius longus]